MTRSLKSFVLFLGVFGTVAVASSQDEYFLPLGVELWGGLKTGMTKADERALGLEQKFELTKDCRVEIATRYKADVLYSVTIRSRWTAAYNRCGTLVKRSLEAKYGAITETDVKSETGIYATRGVYLEDKFITDNIVISLGHHPASGRLYYVTYEPRLVRQEAELIDEL